MPKDNRIKTDSTQMREKKPSEAIKNARHEEITEQGIYGFDAL